jgi:hypothetical protein
MSSDVVLEAFHVKRCHAEDIADAILQTIRNGVDRLWLYFGPDGVIGISLSDNPMLDPFSLVGTYNGNATRQDIVEDIIASQRETIA